jgi:Trk-type K+ transport system membrane component
MLTGGFAPSVAALSKYLNPAALITISSLMFLGSINFDLLYNILTNRLAGLDTSEIITYVLVLSSGTVLLMIDIYHQALRFLLDFQYPWP